MGTEYSNLLNITGVIVNIVYSNDDTGYTICEIKDDSGEKITVVGTIPFAGVGERVDLYGSWTNHQVYGPQFHAERCEKILPTNKAEILRYLSSGTVKGIGPKIAQKIVDKYGEDSFDIIANHGDWLTEIRGISATKAREISEDFREKTGVRDILLACQGYISPIIAMNLYQRWGKEALVKIHGDPYSLCGYGLSFKQADEMAKKSGILKHETPHRIKSGILFVLKTYASRDGHTFVHKHVLIESAQRLLTVDEGIISIMIDELLKEDTIKVVNFNNESHVYLKDCYLAEEYISNKLLLLRDLIYSVDQINSRILIEQVEQINAIKYAPMQKKAIEEALYNGVTVITGGPGTGKTTIIKALLQIFTKMGLLCSLAAPTGRAAKRMSEATSYEASTIHRLLDVHMATDYTLDRVFWNNENNLLQEDVIIIDEASMIDIFLMRDLLKAIKPGARLVLIGDIDQLPAIGEGDVLNDVMKSGCFPVVQLNEIFRQSEESGIVYNAHQIKNGIIPDIDKKYNDFFFIKKENENEIPPYIADLCKNRLPKKYGKDIMNDIQIITPVKRGVVGARNINFLLQETLNPPSSNKIEHTTSLQRTYRVGDKVMQIRNDYGITWKGAGEMEMGIYNGEIGIIRDIDNDTGESIIQFDDRMTKYPLRCYSEIDLAYAITIHKSQGSEYPIVIAVLPKSAPIMLTRNLIYTAITRASKMVIIIGDKKALEIAVLNDKHTYKNTGLARFLTDGDHK